MMYMKKLLTLTTVSFKTKGRESENLYTDDYLVLVEVPHDADQNSICEKAADVVRDKFKSWYPESELITIAPKPTIAEIKGEPEERTEFYAPSAVLEFANWIMGQYESKFEGHVETEHLEYWKKKFNK